MEIPGIAQDFKRDRRKLLLNTPLLAVNCWLLLFRKQKWWFTRDFNTIKVQLIIYRKNWFLLMLFLFAAKMMVYERFQHDKGSACSCFWNLFLLFLFAPKMMHCFQYHTVQYYREEEFCDSSWLKSFQHIKFQRLN